MKDLLRQAYNLIARDWNKDHINDGWWIEATDKYISLFNPGDKILDVGCGSGLKTEYLIKRGLVVKGIDLSDEMIKYARRNVPKAEFAVMDMEDLDDLNEVFDGIYAQAVILHLEKVKVPSLFEKFKRRIKHGGYLYIAVKQARENSPEEEIVTENDYGYEYTRFFSYYKPEEIEKYFTDANFEIIHKSVNLTGKTNWIQVIGKAKNG